MTKHATWLLLVHSTCALLSSCSSTEVVDATQVVVVVDSDKTLQAELTKIHVEVLDEAGKTSVSTEDFELTAKTKLPLSFGVYQPKSGADWFMLKVQGWKGAERRVESKRIEHFERGKKLHVQVQLESDCAGNFCGDRADQTCSAEAGGCVAVGRGDAGQVVVVDDDAGPEDAGSDARPVVPNLPDASPSEAGPNEAGPNEAGPSEPDAGPIITTAPVPPSTTGAATLGGRRTDGTITVYDDGFELGGRVCTDDRKYCVTGSFSP
jgi:hypothetical protein